MPPDRTSQYFYIDFFSQSCQKKFNICIFKRVIVTPAVYPRLINFRYFNIQSTGQKSHYVNILWDRSQCFVLIKQSDSPCPYQFLVGCQCKFGSPPKWPREPLTQSRKLQRNTPPFGRPNQENTFSTTPNLCRNTVSFALIIPPDPGPRNPPSRENPRTPDPEKKKNY